MKWIVLFLLTPLLLHAADETVTWSQPVKGLRARLFISPFHDPDSDRTYQVYLQFESDGTISQPIFFQYSESGLALDVANAKGQKLPHVGPPDIDETTPIWNLSVPPGGNLAFPIGYGGASPPNELFSLLPGGEVLPNSPNLLGGKYLRISSELGWIIPFTNTPAYYLSGTFSTRIKDAIRDSGIRLNWEGTLVLPPIPVSTH